MAKANSKHSRKQTTKQPAVKPEVHNPVWADPIYAAIKAHQQAHDRFVDALEIPEIPQCKALREAEESRTSDDMHKALKKLAMTQPKTLVGVAAALSHFAYSDTDLMTGIEDDQRRFLLSICAGILHLVGQGPTLYWGE